MNFLLGREDWKIILGNLGSIMIIVGCTFALPLLSALYFGEPAYAVVFFLMMVVSVSIGMVLRMFRSSGSFGPFHAVVIAAVIWLLVPLISTLPFIAIGESFVNAYFESMSGWTTTGFTILKDVEYLPKSVLLFRSYTHWLGGVGILLLALTVLRLPKLGQKLYAAETRSENIKLNVFDTAKLIYGVYIALTVLGIALLFIAGMPMFDSVNHAMSAISTGGFSVKNNSIAYYNSNPINLISTILMFLGGTNVVVLYYLMRGKVSVLKNTETMASIVLIAIFTIAIMLVFREDLIKTVFTVVSTLTSTGYTVLDISVWSDTAIFLLVILMYTGASSGSTTGSIKIWRFIIILKDGYREIVKHMKPRHAFMPIRFNNTPVEEEEVAKIKSFVLIYIIVTILFSLIFMALGFSFRESIFTIASAQGNMGISVIQGNSWFNMQDVAKITLVISMWLGRLEILPALVLLRSLLLFRK